LGLQVGGKEHPFFAHGGSNVGFECYLVAYNSGDGAVVMTNGDNGGQLAEEIVSTIAFEYKWQDFQPGLYTISKIDPKVFDAYVGTYQLAPEFFMTVTRNGDHFMTQATGQRPVEIFPESDHQFFARIVNAEITFVTDSSGRATELILHQEGADHHAPRKGGP
jgi:hypothetical protein